MHELLNNLNPEQARAVKTTEGRVLILAGAGSGKTRVLTIRMAHLIKNLNVSPKHILGLTFTNKAAAEMRHRMGAMIEPALAKQVTLCTFHSFCMQVLRQDIQLLGYTNKFSLYDEHDVQRLIKLIAHDLLDRERELPSLQATTSAITSARNKGLKSHEIKDPESEWHTGFTQNLYSRLQDSMRAYNAVDFDNLLGLTVELFEKHPAILEKYQERFRYIMIDEYQDTNPIQYKLASLLSAKYNHLCVVGDDDQSIYGWRGADVRNILEFEKATVIKLEQNYRSTNGILKAANAVIGHNKQRYQKMLWSTKGEGQTIELFHAPTEQEEALAVVCRIVKMKETMNLRWKDFAILYRSNALSRQFELALAKQNWQEHGEWVRGIPYEVFGGTEFYERREVKDLFAYLRVISNPRDQEAILRVINQPRRGIGDAALDAMTAYNRSKNIPLWDVLKNASDIPEVKEKLSTRTLNGLNQFIAAIEGGKHQFETQPLADAMKWVIEKVDYKKAIHEEVKSDQMQAFKWENVQEFVSSMAEFGDKSLHEFITTMPLESSWDRKTKNTTDNKVNLMTFHSAKGLEFPVCFLVGMEDHIIPHEKSLRETGIEEERRLMYVAITRAMSHLVISMARQRKRMGKEYASQPSRFLFDIPKDLLKMVNWHDI